MFDYLSTPEDVKRFIFCVAIGFCLVQAAIEVSKAFRKRT